MEEKDLIKQISSPIFMAKGWLKLLGIMSIIGGVLSALTIIGILICWLPIWMGVLLFKAGNAIEEAQYSGNRERLEFSLGQLKTYFTINGVLTLIGLILVAISFLGAAYIPFGLSKFMHGF